jgi:hypothetical protein
MDSLAERFVGVWELDPTTLSYEFGRPGRRATYTIRRIGRGLEFSLDGDDADGKPMYFVYGGALDGQDRPIPNSPISLCLQWLDDHTIESAAKKDGRVIDRWTRTISDDENSLVLRQHGTRPNGEPFTNTSVYRRLPQLLPDHEAE